MRLYFWFQVAFLVLAGVMIWAYYSPSISMPQYEAIFWWKQRITQFMEVWLCVHLLETRRERLVQFVAVLNGAYAVMKFLPYTSTDVPGEIDKTFWMHLQQWANLGVIIASCIAIALCKFSTEGKYEEPALHQAAR